jgi:flavin reductase (DIM6/NTAB) family NADH-FMN oxidoreductase RutF
VPRVDAAAAWIAGSVVARHVTGDHEIVVGQVIAAERGEHAPLIFLQGRLLALAPDALAKDSPE